MPAVFKLKGSKRYQIEYLGADGKRHRKTGFTDKGQTMRLALRLEQEARLEAAGLAPASAVNWMAIPIERHIQDWQRSMAGREVADDYCRKLAYRVRRLLDLAGICKLADATPGRIQEALGGLGRTISAKTGNDYLSALKSLTAFLRREGRLTGDPLAGVKGRNVRAATRRDRRALTDDELGRLLGAAYIGQTLQGVPGPERALIYAMSAYTGLRLNELRNLRIGDLDFDQGTITVQAAFSKHRRRDILPLPAILATELRRHVAGRNPADLAFTAMRWGYRAIKTDLHIAGIPYQTADGVADFHSLRHTFITRIVRGGADIKTAQLLARHSDPRLTIDRYTHSGLDQLHYEVAKLTPPHPTLPGTLGTKSDPSVSRFVSTEMSLGVAECRSGDEDELHEKLKTLGNVGICRGMTAGGSGGAEGDRTPRRIARKSNEIIELEVVPESQSADLSAVDLAVGLFRILENENLEIWKSVFAFAESQIRKRKRRAG